jgi:hypothetical protein
MRVEKFRWMEPMLAKGWVDFHREVSTERAVSAPFGGT